jgi:CRP-like cAMP-binding protein
VYKDFSMTQGSFDPNKLPAISWLTTLAQEERDTFSSYGEVITIEIENTLIREGETQPNFYFVLRGMLSIKRGSGSSESVVGVVSAGESLGEMTMVTSGAASATVTTLETCTLWRISHESLMKFIRDHPTAGNKILLALLCTVSERLLVADSDLAMLLNERRSKVVREISNPPGS